MTSYQETKPIGPRVGSKMLGLRWSFRSNMTKKNFSSINMYILYARHCKPRLVFFFNPFFTTASAYTADNLCTKQGNLGLKSAAYKPEWLQIKSSLWLHVYSIWINILKSLQVLALIGFAISLAYQSHEGYNAYYSFVYFFHSVSAFLLMGLYLCDKMPAMEESTDDDCCSCLGRVGHWLVVSQSYIYQVL